MPLIERDPALVKLCRELPGIEPFIERVEQHRAALDIPGRDDVGAYTRTYDVLDRPHVVLLRDRDPCTGSSGWHCIQSLLSWSGAVAMINAAPGMDYADVDGVAYISRRVVLIDTLPAVMLQWRAALWPMLMSVVGETPEDQAAYREARRRDRFSGAIH
jgi:hypothetical protein